MGSDILNTAPPKVAGTGTAEKHAEALNTERLPGHAPAEELRNFRLGPAATVAIEVAPGIICRVDIRRADRGPAPEGARQPPEIQYLNEHDFKRIVSMERRSDQPGVYAYYSAGAHAIRVCVPGSGFQPLGERVQLPAEELHRLTASIVHEASRAEGNSEFEAYYRMSRRLYDAGVIEAPPTGGQIIDHIRAHYDQSEVDRALAAFEAFDDLDYMAYMLDRNLEGHTFKTPSHDHRQGYPHHKAMAADEVYAPQNLARMQWDQRHPDPVYEYKMQYPHETVARQADVYERILNRRHMEQAVPLVVPREATFTPFARKLETTRREEEYLQAHLEWRGEMVPGKGWVRYEARMHTNTRVAVPGEPPCVVVGRWIGRSGAILLSDTPEVRKLMADPVEGKHFQTDASGNIWLAEARWQEARTARRPVDNVMLQHGHHHYFPSDEKGRIIR